jgi:hypothetical protein
MFDCREARNGFSPRLSIAAGTYIFRVRQVAELARPSGSLQPVTRRPVANYGDCFTSEIRLLAATDYLAHHINPSVTTSHG